MGHCEDSGLEGCAESGDGAAEEFSEDKGVLVLGRD